MGKPTVLNVNPYLKHFELPYPESYKGENIKLLENAGLLEHDNCIPFLAKTQASRGSKADAELRKWETLDVNILNRKEDKKCQQASLTKQMGEDMLE